jgi:hypothetical protein
MPMQTAARVAADPRAVGMAGLMLIAVCAVMEDQVAGHSAAQRAAGSCEGGQQGPGEDTFLARAAGPVRAAKAGALACRRRCGGTAT